MGKLWNVYWEYSGIIEAIKASHCVSLGLCKKDVTPLLTHWSYVFLALTHWIYFPPLCSCWFLRTLSLSPHRSCPTIPWPAPSCSSVPAYSLSWPNSAPCRHRRPPLLALQLRRMPSALGLMILWGKLYTFGSRANDICEVNDMHHLVVNNHGIEYTEYKVVLFFHDA